MRRAIVALLIVLFTAASAQAVTLKDIVDLTKAGLGDEVLLALIEVDGGVFDVDPATLSRLKAAGVSEKVIVALVRSGRTRPASTPAPEPEAQSLSDVVASQQAAAVTYVEPPRPVVREVAVPYPVYIAVPVDGRGRHGRPGPSRPEPSQPSPQQAGVPPTHWQTDVPAPKDKEPVYWGSGGKLRPDAWKPK
jgi:hypothetical protein